MCFAHWLAPSAFHCLPRLPGSLPYVSDPFFPPWPCTTCHLHQMGSQCAAHAKPSSQCTPSTCRSWHNPSSLTVHTKHLPILAHLDAKQRLIMTASFARQIRYSMLCACHVTGMLIVLQEGAIFVCAILSGSLFWLCEAKPIGINIYFYLVYTEFALSYLGSLVYSRLLVQLTPKGVFFSFFFLLCLSCASNSTDFKTRACALLHPQGRAFFFYLLAFAASFAVCFAAMRFCYLIRCYVCLLSEDAFLHLVSYLSCRRCVQSLFICSLLSVCCIKTRAVQHIFRYCYVCMWISE